MSKRPYSVMIDPGHGGRDPGTISGFYGYKEKDIVLNMVKLLRRLVLRDDYLFTPYLTRNRDKYLSLQKRCDKANKKKVDLFVSFHCNGFSDLTVKGMEVFYKLDSKPSKLLAAETYVSLLNSMNGHDGRGIKGANFYVLRSTEMPSILIEFEFLSNPEQAEYLNSKANQRVMVKAVADTIEYFLEEGGHEI